MGYFSIPIFFVIFRETFEAAIIVSVLLTFIAQAFPDPIISKHLRKQVWIGTALGLLVSLIIGAVFIAIFYLAANSANAWSQNELAWEGSFSLIASFLIGGMSLTMLASESKRDHWKDKLEKSLNTNEKRPTVRGKGKYALMLLPFVSVVREGVEGVLIVGGVSLTDDVRAIPLATICGILLGCLIGYIMYKGGRKIQLKWFFICSTAVMLLMGSGLFSKGVYLLEAQMFSRNLGLADPDSAVGTPLVDVRSTLWYLNCCNPMLKTSDNIGWQIFNALLGWNNVATIGSVVGYCVYWLVTIVSFSIMKLYRKRQSQSANSESQLVESLDPNQSESVVTPQHVVERQD
ncbi:iron permease FTR1/Fip1/EfeU [Polychytrium aggregatum]|uniref:iron permease FTR1/Fip1/EfeU n=1 Tax=Polychytrium aggregatum TaxID=110093 RepID=UPI0022FE12CA|nr:iron permease FTR1/Fip1/EfeU [Polychytrium aggregatum]KAI9193094.1 iron permease FTR1/Fip1/EfeU [Polychytrium aggregatum]